MEDRWQRLEEEIEELKTQVADLQQRLTRLGRGGAHPANPVEINLRQRGLPLLAHGDLTRLLLPANASPEHNTRWYDLLRRYSFRLFVRDLIQVPQGSDVSVLSRYCTEATVRRYLRELQKLGVVALAEDGAYRLAAHHVSSFGPSLE